MNEASGRGRPATGQEPPPRLRTAPDTAPEVRDHDGLPTLAPPARHTHLDTRAVALLLLCCLLWGLNQVAAKVAMAEIPPLTQAAVRSIGGALLVAAWARWREIGRAHV